jgi:hypothetical protein
VLMDPRAGWRVKKGAHFNHPHPTSLFMLRVSTRNTIKQCPIHFLPNLPSNVLTFYLHLNLNVWKFS